MGYIVKNNDLLFITEESTEGTPVNPSAGAEAAQVILDGLEITPAHELLNRAVSNSGIGMNKSRKGKKTVAGSLPFEFKSSGTAGVEPETDLLYRSLLGATRAEDTGVTADDINVAHSSTVIGLADSDANKYAAGDIVRVRRGTSADHISPIASVVNTAGSVAITLLIANPLGAHADGDAISPVVTYLPANSGHPSFTLTHYQEDEVKRQAAGCKAISASLSNWTTGQIPQMAFAFEGISFAETLSTKSVTEVFDSSEPPTVLNSIFYIDGVAKCVNNITLEVANELGFITCTSSQNGRVASRATTRNVTLSIDPYAEDDSIADWNKFDNNTDFSIFFWAGVEDTNAGQFKDIVAVYLPQCQITEFSKADAEGNVINNMSIKAHRGSDGQSDEIYLSMI